MHSNGALLRVLLAVYLFTYTVFAYAKISDASLRSLPGPGNDFHIEQGKLLAPILVPRVPGSDASLKVLQHFVDYFKKELPEWKLEIHNSTSKTPVTGEKLIPFRNLILTRDPPWAVEGEVKRLALVAHYDSKFSPEGFIGATDSAAPCAMIMHTARSIDKALTKRWESMTSADHTDGSAQGIQILLLDGEEAFLNWNHDDSLYGARALAEHWESTLHPALSTYRNRLSSISMFVLLDLLGSKDPNIPSYFLTTHWAYQHMAAVEQRLRSLDLFKSSPNHPSKRPRSTQPYRRQREKLFLKEAKKDASAFTRGMVEDDHIPFMARGVPILHIIPMPFPEVWHNQYGVPDDGEHLDGDTVEDWALLVTAFTAEWMELEGFLDDPKTRDKRAGIPRKAVTDDGHGARAQTTTDKSELFEPEKCFEQPVNLEIAL